VRPGGGAAPGGGGAPAPAGVAPSGATEDLPQPQQKPAQDALRRYVQSAMVTEWNVHGTIGPHTAADDLNPVWAAFRGAKPTDAADVAAVQNAFDKLYELERTRHQLHLAREGTLPSVFWLILLAGGIVTVAFSYFLVMENARVHAISSAVLAAVLAALLFLIVALNFPFTGTVHVSNQPLEHALLMFNEIDRH
jgi:hypothetical protein